MSVSFEFSAEVRDSRGKAAARRMRRLDHKVPAVVYGGGKDPVSLTLDHDKVLHALEHEAVHSHILSLIVDGVEESVVLKAVQRHVFKPKVTHIDFLRVNASEKLTMSVPIHYVGEEEAPGVKDAGGVVSKLMTEVQIKCLPKDLPEYLEVDISAMEIDQSLHLTDLKLPAGVELAQHDLDEAHDHPIVNVHMPKVSKEDVDAEVAEEAAAAAEAEAAGEEADDEAAQSGDEGEQEASEGEEKA